MRGPVLLLTISSAVMRLFAADTLWWCEAKFGLRSATRPATTHESVRAVASDKEIEMNRGSISRAHLAWLAILVVIESC